MLSATECLGKREERTLTIGQWLQDQGMEPYRTVNDNMLHLLFHPRRGRNRALTEKQLQKIFVALYNLDVFREFLLRTDCTGFAPLDPGGIRDRIEKDDLELLLFGFRYLRSGLFDR
jgi:hypothetical protein